MEKMKRIVVLYNSKEEKGFRNFCKAKGAFFYQLNENSVKNSKKAKHHFQLGNIRFDFIDVLNRNVDKFLKNNSGIIEKAFCFAETIDKGYLSVLNKLEPLTNEIKMVNKASQVDLIKCFYDFHQEIDVYMLVDEKEIQKDTIWNFNFDITKNFLTEEEAKKEIKKLAEKRIDVFNKLIEKEKEFLSQLG